MKKKLAIILCCFIILSGSAIAIAAHLMSAPEAIESLSKKEMSQLVAEINDLDPSSVDTEEAAVYTQALAEKTKSVSDKKLEKMIAEDQNSPLLRVMLLQIADSEKRPLDYRSMADLLKSQDTPFDVKYNVLVNMASLHQDADILADCARGEDEDLAFQAMKMLFLCDPQQWYPVAQDMIRDPSQAGEEKRRAAVLEMGAWISNFGTKDMVGPFIDVCDEILHDDTCGAEIKESAAYALSDLRCKEGIEYILRSDVIREGIKMLAVGDNAQVLCDLLRGDPDFEDLQTVLCAVGYYPAKELLSPLQELSGKVAQRFPDRSAETVAAAEKEILNAIDTIAKEFGES